MSEFFWGGNLTALMHLSDGVLGAHCALLLLLSDHLKSLVETTLCCGTTQVTQEQFDPALFSKVVLPEVSFAALAAAKDLIYKGCCQLEKV